MSERTARIAVSLLCACALGMAYANSLGNGFHYDDSHSVLENPHVRHLGNIPSFFTDSAMFSHMASRAMYRPLVLTSLSLNYWVGAYEPWGYHLVNLALHLMCAALVFVLGRTLGLRHLTAALSAMLFGLHPVQAEVVNYVSSRSQSLAALGYLLSLYCYALFARPSDSRPARGGLTYALSVAAFAFALLSKSIALSLPIVLLVWDGLWWRARLRAPRSLGDDALSTTAATPSPAIADRGGDLDGRFDLRHHLPFWVVAGAYLVIVWTQASKALGDPVRTLGAQLFTQIKAAAYYCFVVASPVQLSVEHQFSESTALFSVPVIASGLLLASVAWVVVRAVGWGHFPSAALPLVWAIVALLPSSVVPLNVLVNEHRLYLPLGLSEAI